MPALGTHIRKTGFFLLEFSISGVIPKLDTKTKPRQASPKTFLSTMSAHQETNYAADYKVMILQTAKDCDQALDLLDIEADDYEDAKEALLQEYYPGQLFGRELNEVYPSDNEEDAYVEEAEDSEPESEHDGIHGGQGTRASPFELSPSSPPGYSPHSPVRTMRCVPGCACGYCHADHAELRMVDFSLGPPAVTIDQSDWGALSAVSAFITPALASRIFAPDTPPASAPSSPAWAPRDSQDGWTNKKDPTKRAANVIFESEPEADDEQDPNDPMQWPSPVASAEASPAASPVASPLRSPRQQRTRKTLLSGCGFGCSCLEGQQ